MTEYEAYQEHIQYNRNAYCKVAIHHTSHDAARMLAARRKRKAFLSHMSKYSGSIAADIFCIIKDREPQLSVKISNSICSRLHPNI